VASSCADIGEISFATPENEKDKEARGEQLATGMGGRRRLEAIAHVSLISGIRPAI
jgi:hypothetical protein